MQKVLLTALFSTAHIMQNVNTKPSPRFPREPKSTSSKEMKQISPGKDKINYFPAHNQMKTKTPHEENKLILDSHGYSYVILLMSFMVSLGSCGLGGLLFLICFKGVYARTAVLAGSTVAFWGLGMLLVVNGVYYHSPMKLGNAIFGGVLLFFGFGLSVMTYSAFLDVRFAKSRLPDEEECCKCES